MNAVSVALPTVLTTTVGPVRVTWTVEVRVSGGAPAGGADVVDGTGNRGDI